MLGQLFTQDFLATGICDTRAWKSITDTELDAFVSRLKAMYSQFKADSKINEAATEDEIILKVLAELGWTELLRNQVASEKRKKDVPDVLLFADTPEKQAALKEKSDDRRYRHGLAIVESKRWQRALDRGEAADKLDPGTPSNQILRYLSAVDIASDRRIRWGMLTNGRHWRLYWQGARSRSEEFLEIDIGALVGVRGLTADLEEGLDAKHVLKIFLCTFRKAAFLAQPWDDARRTFHEYALAEARYYEEKVSQDLGGRVFGLVFPDLANALAAYDPGAPRPYSRSYLDEVREAALILLYRLLFVLYAEDRLLLPIGDARYRDYSLRKLRDEVRDKRDAGAAFSKTATRIWDALKSLFASIAGGDADIGLPAYNGGLFENHHAGILDRARIPDDRMVVILDELSRRVEDVSRYWINYRDLSVQQLGSIYERLLEYRLEEDGGKLVAQPTSFARKTTGSFYTHDDLVKLIIEETVGPLVAERRNAFEKQLAGWNKRRELKPADWKFLDTLDPATAILNLRICDPAMGSGHFLVSLVDYLGDVILETMDAVAERVARQPWAKKVSNPWRSSLVDRIADIRERILAAARQHRWTVDAAQLDDRHIVRRMILKRVIHGVDKNPMAVELAKVALWLHTFTVGAPLSFLDHHLRCGDSLHGERLDHVQEQLQQDLGVMFQQAEMFRIEIATQAITEIAELTDIDVAEAHQSKKLLDDTDRELAPLNALLSLWRSLRWLVPKWPNRKFDKDDPLHQGVAELFSGRHDLMRTMVRGRVEDSADSKTDLLGDQVTAPRDRDDPDMAVANAVIQKAQALAARERFLHWPLAFPHVWSSGGRGGFDAIIGNPPWDRIKLQEVEWFSERKPEIAMAVRAADRKKMIDGLEKKGDPLYQDYFEAAEAAETAARVTRECGDYPLLSAGDINLYSLFVERAAGFIHRRGLVGLLTPSGIAADKSAAEFFGSVSNNGRLAVLFDFENRYNPGGSYFPDVDSRFKFAVFVFGGEGREFKSSRCAFYLHDVAELKQPDKMLALTAADFEIVNPNTGGAPIFRTRRDAEITTAIYRRQPVLVDRRPERTGGKPKRVWPVRYVRMFDMTNDSKLFKRRDELEKTGWYPVEGNRHKKGDAIAVPLYVGRMIHIYDHRSAHVTIDADNLHNPASSDLLSLPDKEKPDCYPAPQYWVSESDVPDAERRFWAVGFRDIARATDVRTMIAAVISTTAAGNTLPLVLSNEGDETLYAKFAPLMVANFNSLAFDYVARQKAQSTHLNWYIVEQLPLIKPEQFDTKIKNQKIADFVRGEVLRLSYTAHDLEPFARDLGHKGPPFKWDEEDRRHRMARLDALFFHLYGISRDDASYILDTFPIVREQDEKAFGRYMTKELILAYMNAVAAGDLTSVVKVG